ncbi:MAG: type III polyketide synthase [Chloroflexi bacterium]|nr:type III polyketide synthase [Chloroflexota bacterium]
MKDVRVVGLGTANPPLRLSQDEIYQAYVELLPLSDTAKSLLKRIFVDNQSIGFRHLGMDAITDALQDSQDALITRYQKFAVAASVEAARKALDDAGLAPNDVDALVVNTCTGYLCPGLTSYVAEALSLKKHVRPFDLQGMGCGGAIPNLETAFNFLQAHPNSHVLTVTVEICSATLYFDEAPDILVSNAIFGDGAAATVMTNESGENGHVFFKGFSAGLFPQDRQHLHYRTENSKLRNVLSQRVPIVGARHGEHVIDHLLDENDLTYQDITHWIVHPGGERVLDAFQRTLDLPDEAVAPSRTVLYNYGNMSSASVLFVLEEVLRNRAPQPGDLGVICSFGAGFSTFAGLVEFA